METRIILTITHKNPMPDLTDKVAGRVWSLQGVEGAEAALDEEPQLAQPVNAELVEALKRVCNHGKRASTQINDDWDFARSVPSRTQAAQPQQKEGV